MLFLFRRRMRVRIEGRSGRNEHRRRGTKTTYRPILARIREGGVTGAEKNGNAVEFGYYEMAREREIIS